MVIQEQRKHPRVSARVTVTCELADGTTIDGTAADVSMGGMFVEASTIPPFGARVVVVCPLAPGSGAQRFEAIVRWNKPGGFGVQFGLLGARETHALAAFIKQRS